MQIARGDPPISLQVTEQRVGEFQPGLAWLRFLGGLFLPGRRRRRFGRLCRGLLGFYLVGCGSVRKHFRKPPLFAALARLSNLHTLARRNDRNRLGMSNAILDVRPHATLIFVDRLAGRVLADRAPSARAADLRRHAGLRLPAFARLDFDLHAGAHPRVGLVGEAPLEFVRRVGRIKSSLGLPLKLRFVPKLGPIRIRRPRFCRGLAGWFWLVDI